MLVPALRTVLVLLDFSVFWNSISGNIMSVTLHTDLGDIKLELNVAKAPKACEVSLIAEFLLI